MSLCQDGQFGCEVKFPVEDFQFESILKNIINMLGYVVCDLCLQNKVEDETVCHRVVLI